MTQFYRLIVTVAVAVLPRYVALMLTVPGVFAVAVTNPVAELTVAIEEGEEEVISQVTPEVTF